MKLEALIYSMKRGTRSLAPVAIAHNRDHAREDVNCVHVDADAGLERVVHLLELGLLDHPLHKGSQ